MSMENLPIEQLLLGLFTGLFTLFGTAIGFLGTYFLEKLKFKNNKAEAKEERDRMRIEKIMNSLFLLERQSNDYLSKLLINDADHKVKTNLNNQADRTKDNPPMHIIETNITLYYLELKQALEKLKSEQVKLYSSFFKIRSKDDHLEDKKTKEKIVADFYILQQNYLQDINLLKSKFAEIANR